MKSVFTFLGLFLVLSLQAQTASIKGQVQDDSHAPIAFANVVLYQAADSALFKVEVTDELGFFALVNLPANTYYLEVRYIGVAPLRRSDIRITEGQQLDLGMLALAPASVELAEAVVTASRALVEIKPDRTVFNVEGTINSIGSDAISLLRKAPGVTVDNNDNISVLGRSGVLIYVDGKRLPLSSEDLASYLQNLPAEQIDRIDIITNPGARYEAEGNAGIIDIRLKKDQSMGGNGSVSATYAQGQLHRFGLSGTGNYRNQFFNTFGSAGYTDAASLFNMKFINYQNALVLDEINNFRSNTENYNVRIGTDFFLADKHTLGFLVSANHSISDRRSYNYISLAQIANPENIDSILIADNREDNINSNQSYNLNYRFDNRKGRSLNVDFDLGRFQNESLRFQPNQYFNADESLVISEVINSFDTPTDIDIYTAKADYEDQLAGGNISTGVKISQVISDNTFLFFEEVNGSPVRDDRRSNTFEYNERVLAGYLNYARAISEAWNFTAGLRAEHSDVRGDLQTFLPELAVPPVEQRYLSWFPSAGLTWQVAQNHLLALNYGRRINRPNYQVLNPFNNQMSELSFMRGNPFLQPEIVNNLELGYTLAYRYNLKVAYSRTNNQITRLIGPDDSDPRANFITWANLAEQTTMSANLSVPVQILKPWNAYFNISAAYIDNQADYGNGAVVDVQVFTYSIYQQHTIDLPFGFKGEVSGYYNGPSVWGGVFRVNPNWALDLGLQRKFLQNRLNARVSFSDIFFTSGWDGESEYYGLISVGNGYWDSRRASISLSYQIGNEKVRQARKRKTGLEEEAKRTRE